MTKLFGIDIAKVINDEIQNAGGVLSGVLTTSTPGSRTGGNLTDGTNPTSASVAFNGFVESRVVRGKGAQDSLVTRSVFVLTILGASISVIPQEMDTAVIDSQTWKLLELIGRDPASAVYEFRVEAT